MIVTPKVRGKGKLLREDLRQLPGELVTSDIEDEGKIHPLDPPHIQEALKHERREKIKADGQEAPTTEADTRREFDHNRPISKLGQRGIDAIYLRVLREHIRTLANRCLRGDPVDLQPKHLWFTKDDFNAYELRDGNPPADSERPRFLRGLRLEIDPTSLRKSIRDQLITAGNQDAIRALDLANAVGKRMIDPDDGLLVAQNDIILPGLPA